MKQWYKFWIISDEDKDIKIEEYKQFNNDDEVEKVIHSWAEEKATFKGEYKYGYDGVSPDSKDWKKAEIDKTLKEIDRLEKYLIQLQSVN